MITLEHLHPAHFIDRRDAGRRLATLLLEERTDATIVLGLPRGGVIVAAEIARALGAPLDTWAVRKLGAPLQPELAIGAIAEGGGVTLDEDMAVLVGATPSFLSTIVADERAELERRARAFHPGGRAPTVAGQNVIVVDDGVATGHTALAALRAIRSQQPARLVFAAPVGAAESLARLEDVADRVVCAYVPRQLVAVGFFYDEFSPTTDEEVRAAIGIGP